MPTPEEIRARFSRFGPRAEAEEEEGGIGSAIGDIITDLAKDVIDVPVRIAAIPELAIRELGAGFEDPGQQEELREKALGGAFDIASLAFPAGRIAKGLGIVGKGLGKQAGRAALAGVKTSPFFVERETAGQPAERVQDVGELAALGALTPPAVAAAKPVIKGIGRAVEPAVRPIRETIQDIGKVARARFFKKTKPPDIEEASRIFHKKLISGSPEQLESFVNRQGGEATRFIQFVSRLLDDADLPEKLTLTDLNAIWSRGTYSKLTRREFSEVITSTDPVEVSAEIIKQLQREAATLSGQYKAILETFKESGELAVQALADKFLVNLKSFTKRFMAFRSEAGRSLGALRKTWDDFQDIVRSVHGLNQARTSRSLLDRLKKQELTGRDLIRYWTVNIFPLGSPFRDGVTGAAAIGSQSAQNFNADLFDFVFKGATSFARSNAMLKALAKSGRTKLLPESVRTQLQPTALGEHVAGDFIIADSTATGFFAELLRKMDKFLFFPARAKRAVDTWSKTVGAFSVLIEEGTKKANQQGLKGTVKADFVRNFLANPADDVAQKAVERAQRLGFNRALSRVEENIAANPWVRLLATPFPRWNFQFTRWFAEHTPFDPRFWGKVTKGTATDEDMVKAMTRWMTGAGAVYFVDQMLYDRTDFRNGQLVLDDGSRVSLRGIDPIPAALSVSALLRGDFNSASVLIGESSFALTPLFAMEGILKSVGQYVQAITSGQLTIDSAQRALVGDLARLIPGQGMLRAIERIFDPTLREGALQNVPLLSQAGRPRVDPTTGGERRLRTRLPFQDELGGGLGAVLAEFPGAPRVTNRIEQVLFSLGFGVREPRTPPFLQFEGELGLPEDALPRFRKIRGELVNKRLGKLVNSSRFKREFKRYQDTGDTNLLARLRRQVQSEQSKITSVAQKKLARELRIPLSRLREEARGLRAAGRVRTR